jgi:redox-sensitive bicupin YhaK (pirin superfamily)
MSEAPRKNILSIVPPPAPHWVGDGFPVRSLFTYDALGAQVSPFLLLDYAGPAQFGPADRPRGVGEHPHRGFETVTLVYSGEVSHRDSAGGGGTIGPGDVQWMTAGAGILHDEFHSADFTRTGGMLEMAQLWVNLPARHKMTEPRYQTIVSAAIPEVRLPHGAGRLRVIAGEHAGIAGPASTFSPLHVWDLRISAGRGAALEIEDGHNMVLAVLRGTIRVNDGRPAGAAQLVVLDRAGGHVQIDAGDAGDAMVLVLGGAPIDEPIVGYGPFVMNTREEIQTAMDDFRRGAFGRMAPKHTTATRQAGVMA